MRFACPQCAQPQLRLSDKACPQCGWPLTFEALLSHYWGRLWLRFRQVTHVQCPACKRPIPIRATSCPHPDCGAPISVEAVLAPSQRRWRQFLERPPARTVRRIHWVYFLFSVGLLWWLLESFPEQSTEVWLGRACVTAVHLGVLGLLAVLLVPREVFVRFRRGLSTVLKLAVLVNYLTLVLLLQRAVVVWWRQALLLGGIFLVSYAGAWVLSNLLWPMAASLREVSSQAQGTQFNASAPQGRKGEEG